MTEAEAHTVSGLATALLAVSHEYLKSFEPTASVDVASIRLEINGPKFNLVFSQTGPNGPSIQLSMNEIDSSIGLTDYKEVVHARAAQEQHEQERRGLFGGRS